MAVVKVDVISTAQGLNVSDHSRAIHIASQGGPDLLGNFTQGERTRALKKAWMLHGSSPRFMGGGYGEPVIPIAPAALVPIFFQGKA